MAVCAGARVAVFLCSATYREFNNHGLCVAARRRDMQNPSTHHDPRLTAAVDRRALDSDKFSACRVTAVWTEGTGYEA
jgi:hypothetical protein